MTKRWNNRNAIQDLPNKIGENVEISGWIQFSRKSGKVRFLGLRDGTGIAQCVLVRDETPDEAFGLFSQLKNETSVRVAGRVDATDRGRQGAEIFVESIEILGNSENYPVTPKEHGIDFLLSHRHLWLRSKKQVALFKIRDATIRAIREFFRENRFVLMDSPILTKTVGEDPSGLFAVDYFDLGKAYLAQTGQLYLEASIFAHGRVFCLGPTFRAEKSKTRRHLTEFWMVEGEMAFMDNDDNMDVQEDMVKFVIERILDTCEEHLEVLERDPETLRKVSAPFKRLAYSDAVEILQEKGSGIVWGHDLGAADENLLAEDSDTPVFVYDYPKEAKAFYMKINEDDPRTVKCADLLAPEGYGEIIGGSQREDDVDTLLRRIEENNPNPEAYQWYLDLRRYGTVVHSGFGLGIERFVGYICGLRHIRETIPFPRLMERIVP